MISVVGGGASGIGAAYSLLSAGHKVSIYEAESNLGGHCYGVPIECLNGEVAYVDAGVSDFNQQNFVNVKALLDDLGLTYYPVIQDASFMTIERKPLWYTQNGEAHYSRKFDNLQLFQDEIARFVTTCQEVLDNPLYKDWTTEKYLHFRKYSDEFRCYYFYPRAAGCFPMPDCPPENFMIRTLVAFYTLHGIVGGKPAPRMVVKGGMFTYCRRFEEWFQDKGGRLFCDTPVIGIARRRGRVRIRSQNRFKSNRTDEYDHVVIATNSNQVVPLLEDPTKEETRIFNSFQWQRSRIVVHRDDRVMPCDKKAWRSYNYLVGDTTEIEIRPTITFYPHSLASLSELSDVFVTMNPYVEPADDLIIHNKFFVHPAAGKINDMACESVERIQGYRNTWYAGSFLREPFVHEQAYSSGFDIGVRLSDFLESGDTSSRFQMLAFDDFLAQVPLFEGLDLSELSDLNLAVRPFRCSETDVLFRQGDQPTGMYLIRNGNVSVQVRVAADEPLQVSMIGEYGIVGEMALMDNGVRSATATAETDVDGYFISCKSFEMLQADLRPTGISFANCLARDMSYRCQLLIEGITKEQSMPADTINRYESTNPLFDQTVEICDASILQMFKIFDGFSRQEIMTLVDESYKLTVPSGASLFKQHDSPDAIYIVIRGALRFGHVVDDQYLQFGILGPGSVAGLTEVITNRTRLLDLSAREDSILLRIAADHYKTIIDEVTPLAFKLVGNVNTQLVGQLRNINNMAARLSVVEKLGRLT